MQFAWYSHWPTVWRITHFNRWAGRWCKSSASAVFHFGLFAAWHCTFYFIVKWPRIASINKTAQDLNYPLRLTLSTTPLYGRLGYLFLWVQKFLSAVL